MVGKRGKDIILKRNDLILFLVLIGAALVLSLVLYGKENGGGIVVVQVDGKKTASYPLDQDRDVMIRVPGGGYNHLMIRNGECYLTGANCPDQLCVKQGKISKDGQSIICLPHRLVITVWKGEKSGVDTVAQ